MKRLIYFIIIALLFNLVSVAQDKNFTMEDVVINSYTSLAPSTLKQLQWLPNEYSYSFVEEDGIDKWLIKGFASSGKKTQLLSFNDFADELIDYDIKAPKEFPTITWIDDLTFDLLQENMLFSYSVESSSFEVRATFPPGSEDVTYSKDKSQVAFTYKNNLYIVLNEKENKHITSDGKYGVTNGKPASRNEFGIERGIFWSPKSNYLAFYHEDLSYVSDYPILDITTTPAQIEKIKYPMAGDLTPVVTIGIYNMLNKEVTWLKTDGPKDQYLTNVTWSPDEKHIFVGHLNRDQNHFQLVKYDAVSGEKVKLLFEEKDEQYVEPLNQLEFLSNDPTKFIWISRRDGWKHLYLYGTDGEMKKQLTKGKWEVTEYLGTDKKGNYLYVVGTMESPLERHLYKISFQDEEIYKRLTTKIGTHEILKHRSMRYFIDMFSSITTPNEITILTEKGDAYGIIHKAPNPIKDYAVGQTKLFSIMADDDSTDLYCRMIYPSDFNENNNYPVIVYVYGGPHNQMVKDKWAFGKYAFWFNYMAQKGYIIFTLDNRGSGNRGLEFEQVIHRRLGTVELQDQLTGLEYLYSLPYINKERVGVYGWSYGGFMATTLMTRSNGAFKVGVAGGAVIDWKYYKAMYTERYMDTPQQNRDGYENASLLNHIKNLDGKLLEVHGSIDPCVVWQHTLKLCEEAVNLNIPLDYFPYLGHPHHVSGTDKIHLYNKISNYFLDNL